MTKNFKARTEYDLPHLADLKRIAGKTMDRHRTLIHRGLVLVASVGCVVLGLLVLASQKPNFLVAGLYFVLGIGMLAAFIKYYEVMAWQALQKMKKKPQVPDCFTFGEYGVDISRGSETAHYPYSDCDRLMETDLALYLFHKSGKGLTISKRQVEGGTPEQLRSWLEEKCGLKAQRIEKEA